jgi:hypothetical protein
MYKNYTENTPTTQKIAFLAIWNKKMNIEGNIRSRKFIIKNIKLTEGKYQWEELHSHYH